MEREPATNYLLFPLFNKELIPSQYAPGTPPLSPCFLMPVLIHLKLDSHSTLGCNCGLTGLSQEFQHQGGILPLTGILLFQ